MKTDDFPIQKEKLYEKLSQSIHDGIAAAFWADIDLGGFRMFEKLHAIFSKLVPMRMGAEEVEKFHLTGKERSEDYLAQLNAYLKENKFPLFSKTIEQVLNYGVTIEQEVFLTEYENSTGCCRHYP